jgi:hypothetical protein
MITLWNFSWSDQDKVMSKLNELSQLSISKSDDCKLRFKQSVTEQKKRLTADKMQTRNEE